MVPFTASEVPVPKALPPEDDTELSAVARIVAFSSAVNVILPAVDVTVPSSMKAAAAPRTSLTTTMPPIAFESDGVRLLPCGIRLVSGTSCQKSRSV